MKMLVMVEQVRISQSDMVLTIFEDKGEMKMQ